MEGSSDEYIVKMGSGERIFIELLNDGNGNIFGIL